jgi:hypothetical protein
MRAFTTNASHRSFGARQNYAILFDTVNERMPGDPQKSGSGGLVPPVSFQGHDHNFALQLLERIPFVGQLHDR